MRSATAEADVPQNSAGHEDARQFNSNHLNLPRADSRSADSQPADPQQNDLLNRNLDYLFEEDEKKSPPHWRMYVALALLVITAATLVWQWRRNGYPWDNLAPPTTGQNMGTAPAGAQAAATSAAAAYPTTRQNPPAPAAPETAAKPAPGLVPESSKPEVPESNLSRADAPTTEPQKAPQLQTASRKQGGSATILPSEAMGSDQVKSSAASASEEPTAQEASKPAAPAGESSEGSASASNASLAEASSPTEAVQLLAEGTKYLLGNGVEQDCERANKDLRAAARFSSDAQSTLGTMYASGHCVSRDLPTAYRWYARALRGRPGNSRIQDDLTVLWNQMTPAERQTTSHSQP